ncbi:hypothetical protein [Actinokineospora pegani]|uniref:hypothetical protein n=1 Tax=Actinokineospora pegani TaxID=2654637 RepID=UPI0012EAE28B|nr:hypothetical protein [Actinokineospora pegani]
MGSFNPPRDDKGRFTKYKMGAAAGVTGVAVAFSGGGTAGTTAATAGEAAGAANPVSVAARNSARKTKSDKEWKRLRLRTVKQAVENAVDCAANSYGTITDFFLRNPCRSLDRTLITLADPNGATFVVSVSWVRMRARSDVAPLKRKIDRDGTGSIAPLGWSLLKSQGVRFTGVPFRSRVDGDTLVIAEGAVVSGAPGPAYQAAVEAAARL